MKILWHSVAPWCGTGYGQQTATFTPRIKALGHDVAISAYYGLGGAKMAWQGIDVYPPYAKAYGSDMMVPHAVHHFGAEQGTPLRAAAALGLIVTLGDVWTFDAPLLATMNVAAWVPIDHETVPAQVAAWFAATRAVPVAMSRFGQRALQHAGFESLYVPHGIDTAVFCPGDKAQARQKLGLPTDAFVVAMVAANIGKDGARKAFYEQILAFSELRKRHSDAVLVLHTDATNPYGVSITDLLSDLPAGSWMVTDQYPYRAGLVSSSTVADLYRAADLVTNCSWGEGFGVPIVEAQACGTPVVVTDTTAMPELVGAGWTVPGEPMWHDSMKAWARRPLISAIAHAYRESYDQARDDQMRAQAWEFAQQYDADLVVAEHWKPALDELDLAMSLRAAQPPRPRQPKVREADGLLWVDRGPGDALGWESSHEAELRDTVEALLPDGGVLLDVGAHVGHWSVRLAGRAGHVYAVEANPDAASGLRRNLALNDIGNVTVIEVAAWDRDHWLSLEDPNGQTGGGSTRTVLLAHVDTEVPAHDGHDCFLMQCPGYRTAVPARRLDEVPELAGLDRLDLIKLDVEGADLHALRGMSGLLHKHKPTLFIETHDCYGYYSRSDLETLLAQLGYQWQVTHTYHTHWQPDGISDTPVAADYLLCTPTGGG